MSDIAIGRDADASQAFRPLTVVLMLMIGILAFAGMLVLGAYAPDLRSGKDGGTHVLSNGVTGFSGLYQLAQATGRNPRIIRDDRQFATDDLVVLSPPNGFVDVSKATQGRVDKPTLMILPKWDTEPDPLVTGWVRYKGLHPRYVPEGVLAPNNKLTITRRSSGGAPLMSDVAMDGIQFSAPRPLQSVAGDGLHPLITDKDGRIVLGELGDLYVLADPDLLSNRGMKDESQARSALALLDFLQARGAHGIAFDVTLNGLGRSPSPLKLAFDPPFLAMTLAIVAALLLAGLHALGRFGPPQLRQRAIAFGKAALVDNTAALVRKAGREAMLGRLYLQVIRDRAAQAFGAPGRLREGALDIYFDKLGRQQKFSDLAHDAKAAADRHELLAAAQALYDWQGEKSG